MAKHKRPMGAYVLYAFLGLVVIVIIAYAWGNH